LVVGVSDGISVEQRLAALEAQIAAIAEERDEYRKLVLHLREENERLKRGLLGQKAERLPKNDAQLSLLMLGLALGGETDAPAPAPPPERSSLSTRVPSPCAGRCRTIFRASGSRLSLPKWSAIPMPSS
jgi:hypothetical protein